MTTDQNPSPNAEEGADPSADIKEQNPGETTTADLSQGQSEPEGGKDKVQKLAKAGRPDFDPNLESPG